MSNGLKQGREQVGHGLQGWGKRGQKGDEPFGTDLIGGFPCEE